MTGFQILREYMTFDTLESMNESVANHKENHLTESANKLLDYIARLASNNNGACRSLYENISKNLKVSVSTVKRSIKMLKDLGAIRVIPQRSKKQSGGGVSAIIQILPFKINDTLLDTPPVIFEDSLKPNISSVCGEFEEEKTCSNLLINLSSKDLSNVNNATELNNLMIDYISKGVTKTMFLNALKESENRKPRNIVNYMRVVMKNIISNIEKKSERTSQKRISEADKRPRKKIYNWLSGKVELI